MALMAYSATMSAVNSFRENVRKAVVVRMSAIGDIILTLPVLDVLGKEFPRAEIHYVTKKEFAPLVTNHPAVARVWEFDPKSGPSGLLDISRRLRQEDFDLFVDLHGSLRSTVMRLFSNAPIKRTYRKMSLLRSLSTLMRNDYLADAPPVCARYLTALEDFGIGENKVVPRLHLGQKDREEARTVLSENGISQGDGFIAVAPGASYPTKMWSPEAFGTAAAKLSDGNTVVVLGGHSDRETADRVVKKLEAESVRAVDLSGRLSITGSAAVVEMAELLLANDSGLMHMAEALATPLVAVFGPTTRGLGFYPQGDLAVVVEAHDLPCRPCTRHGDQRCPEGHHLCMEKIEVNDVVDAARRVLSRFRDRGNAA